MDRENNSSELKNVGQSPRVEITLDIGKLSLSQSELCEIYHHVPQFILKNAIKVNVAEHKSIQYSRDYEVFIAEERNGNYFNFKKGDIIYDKY